MFFATARLETCAKQVYLAARGKNASAVMNRRLHKIQDTLELRGRELREAFDTDEYQVMLVANKFQTGFDQPKLVAMYVDKKLSGVTTVQTLSRLNRIYPGKTDTFVIDFVNDENEILAEFKKYHETAELSDVTDPNIIHDLQSKLDATGIYTFSEVDAFVAAYLKPKAKQSEIQSHIAPAVQRFRVRMKEAKASVPEATLITTLTISSHLKTKRFHMMTCSVQS